MVNSSGFAYTQRHREKQDIKAECDISKLNVNCGDGNLVKTDTWIPLLRNINNLEIALQNQRSHCRAELTSD